MSCLKRQLLQTPLWWRQYRTPSSKERCLLPTVPYALACALQNRAFAVTFGSKHCQLTPYPCDRPSVLSRLSFCSTRGSCPFSSFSSYIPSIIALRKSTTKSESTLVTQILRAMKVILTKPGRELWPSHFQVAIPQHWTYLGWAAGLSLRPAPPGCPQDISLSQNQRDLGIGPQQLCSVSRSWLGNISVSTSVNAARNTVTFMVQVKTQN